MLHGPIPTIVWPVALLCGWLTPSLPAAPRLEFTRMVAHWADYADPGYLPFIDDAKPELVQVGFYGAHFWSLADTAFGNGYPAHFPVRGHRACAEWFSNLNRELHRREVKVIGHLNLEFLVGDPQSDDGPRGFFRFYRDHWDESLLGPKPVSDPLDLLEKDSEGQPISESGYSIGGMREYWACLNNPHWRQVLRSWVKFAVAQGVDGLIVNYFYRHDCHCVHCVTAFKEYLAERYTTEELKDRFAIANLPSHHFEEIGAWHDPAQSTPLRREALRFSQIANKQAFDEVFVRYGRSLKPDLIVAQWNHLGDFNQISGDERCLLPAEMWGRDEDYLWYSTGGVTNPTDLTAGILGEATLQLRYIRGAFDDKPFTLGRYENVRLRSAIAELAANGGAPMGFYTSFKDPEARKELVRYYRFLEKHQQLYQANRSHAEILLLFPRNRIHQGDIAALTPFKELGQHLLNEHVLFDILPDDQAGASERARYTTVFDPSDASLTPAHLSDRLPIERSRFDAPFTIRVSASRPSTSDELTLHLVNYNRHEPTETKSPGRTIRDEQPIPSLEFDCDIRLPSGRTVDRIEFLTPENENPILLQFQSSPPRVRVRVPSFVVYGILRIQLSKPAG